MSMTVPKITALSEQPAGSVCVELDGAVWRTVPVAAAAAAGLRVGAPLDRERARTLRRALRRSGALETAARALSRRDRTRNGVRELLEDKGFTEDERREAVGSLERLGFLDDKRFALTRAEALARRGYGDEAIRFDLERQGVTGQLTEAAVSSLGPELARARAAVGALQGPKAYRRLAAKGFSLESIEAAIGTIET